MTQLQRAINEDQLLRARASIALFAGWLAHLCCLHASISPRVRSSQEATVVMEGLGPERLVERRIRQENVRLKKLPGGFCPAAQSSKIASVISVVDISAQQDAFGIGHYPILQLRASIPNQRLHLAVTESCSPS